MKRLYIRILRAAMWYWAKQRDRAHARGDTVREGYYWGKFYDLRHLLEDHGVFHVEHTHAKKKEGQA